MRTPVDVSDFNHTIPRKQPPRNGYGFIAVIIGIVQSYAAPLVEALEKRHRYGGRRGYPPMGMLSAAVLQYVLNERYANRFLNNLDGDLRLLEICSLERAPTETAYSRFKKRLTDHQAEIDRISALALAEASKEIERLRLAGIVSPDAPRLGEYLAIDSTDIEAYGNPKRKMPRDPNAAWGHRTAKNKSNSSKDDELFYGYKNHEIGDAYYGLPIGGIMLPANAGDGPQVPIVLNKIRQQNPWISWKYFIGDKAYAGQERLQFVVNQGMIPVVSVPKPQKDDKGRRLYDGIYDPDGRPTCLGNQPMEYVRSDDKKGHLFHCPSEKCHLKNAIQWTTHCDSEHWEKPEGKLLRIIGILPRFTDEWKRIYRMRTSIERYFRSAKHSRLLNQHQVLSIEKVSLHVSLSRLSYLATALGHLKANDYAGMRHMRVRLPDVREAKVGVQFPSNVPLPNHAVA